MKYTMYLIMSPNDVVVGITFSKDVAEQAIAATKRFTIFEYNHTIKEVELYDDEIYFV